MTVSADGVLERGYAAFAAFLRGREHHVIPYAYDWRLSLETAAAGLAELIARRLEKSREPVRVVAHSMGGLVARLLIANHGDLWARAVAQGARLVQLGTPNGGSFVIPVILRGEEELVRKLAVVDLDHGPRQWVEMLAAFPGLLEMAPQKTTPSFFEVATWKKLGVLTAPSSADLAAAKKTVGALVRVSLADHPVVYVAGRADQTPTMLPGSTVLGTTSRGDGRVTWESGIPTGVSTWFVDVAHGSLADSRPAFEGLLELLVAGKTERLSTTEPPPRKSAGRAVPELEAPGAAGFTPEEQLDAFPTEDQLEAAVFPTQEALEAAALGMEEEEPWEAPPTAVPVCEVHVVHGDLSYARHPVMVGHYAGDPLLSAEGVLDRRLGGALSARHLLGLYAGDVGTHEVVLRQGARAAESQPAGAIVVGLGGVGTLTPGGLTRTIEEAVVRYVRTSYESSAATAAARQGLGLASLLIGSGEAGLSLEQVIRSILLGVRLANQRVRPIGGATASLPVIDRLELLELYEDRALQSLHVLRGLARLGFDDFSVQPVLEHAAGARRRASFREPPGWWLPLTICQAEGKPHVLQLVTGSQRARVVPDEVHIQPELIDRLLARPLASVSPAHQRLAETLFELLLPLRLKKSAADRQNVLLILDEAAAHYPWEMLTDRLASTRRPVGVDAGLVRQLRLERHRVDVSHPESQVALVVGDPPSSLPVLDGAREEAVRAADLLARRSWTVVRQIRGDVGSEKSPGRSEIDAQSVLTTAMTVDPRILHLAGHGVYDPAEPTCSGMVIGGDHRGSKLDLLAPSEVAQMRFVPELVFVNCCHLGRIEATPPHLLAANLATQFIANGVRAVVAAGWAVDDAAALTFAETFYEQIFRGRTFGDAVFEARRRTYEEHPESNTWAAYQCYGDPGFRMMDVEVRATVAESRPDEYVDPVEVVDDLYNLLGRAKCERSDDDKKRLKDELDRIEGLVVAHQWDQDGGIQAGLARAYAEIGELEPATRHYEQARS
ncbi:MAG TPA: CHAT domain-containing protein, partial [Thermoanaerobaculia bacterium]